MKRRAYIIFLFFLQFLTMPSLLAQINTDQVIQIGRNAIYFEDYVLSIQYFNQVIGAKPYLAQPYYYRGVAKFNLEDFSGAEADASMAIDRNPFITDAYILRGMARQNLGHAPEAITDYDKALSMQPDNWDLNFKRALAQESIEDYDGASTSFTDIIQRHPSFDAAYIGRARLNLTLKDTIAALDDINKAIEINPNAINAYIIRADIAINQQHNYQQALADMDKAIKLQPRHSGLFINRAFLRYKLDDYFGAMGDYDYALQLDPLNSTALFNRSVLRTEVRDYNNALADLDQIIAMNPTNYKALFNRASVHNELKQYKAALADADAIINSFPDLASAYVLRFDIRQRMGDKNAKTDYDRAIKMAKQQQKDKNGKSTSADEILNLFDAGDITDDQDLTAARFNQLLTISDNANLDQDYNGKGIRGRIQDRNISIEPEPIFVATYYSVPTELKPTGEYLKEIDEVNRTHALNYLLQVTNREATLTDSTEIKRHFNSIEYYNSYLSTHSPRAIDYFGRAMNQMTLHNYQSASADFGKALQLAPDFALASFMNAVAKYREAMTDKVVSNKQAGDLGSLALFRAKLQDVITEFESALKSSPKMYLAYYNMGVVFIAMQDYTSALSAFNKAIDMKPDFGEAFYNRGYVYFTLGNRNAGSSDLSRAGQLGVAPSYNLLKRMSD